MGFDKTAAHMGLSAAITGFAALIAGPALAQSPPPYYQASIRGTYFDTQLGRQDFGQSTPNLPNSPGSFTETRTNWQVDAVASPTHGGTAQSDILAAAPNRTPGGYAEKLTSHAVTSYYFTVGGPVGQSIGIFVGAKGTISWSQGGTASAVFTLPDYTRSNGQFLIDDHVSFNDPGNDTLAGTSTFADNRELILTGGDTYSVVLGVDTSFDSIEYRSAPDGSFPDSENHAVVDPTFTIDPNYQDANLFTLEADGGPLMSAPAGVPEAATWAMMLGGFGLVGGAMRRRRSAIVSFC